MDARDPVPAWIWTLAGLLFAAAVFEARPARFAPAAIEARTPAGFAPQGPLVLQRAAPRELRALPGIGETRAREIARSRFEDGPIDSAGDLERLHGIGPATVARVRAFLAREGSPPP